MISSGLPAFGNAFQNRAFRDAGDFLISQQDERFLQPLPRQFPAC